MGLYKSSKKLNTVLNGWNNIPRRGKIFIAKNIYHHTFDPVGVVPHLNKIFYKYLIPSGLSKTSKKKNLIITDKNRLIELIKAGDNGLLVERIHLSNPRCKQGHLNLRL